MQGLPTFIWLIVMLFIWWKGCELSVYLTAIMLQAPIVFSVLAVLFWSGIFIFLVKRTV